MKTVQSISPVRYKNNENMRFFFRELVGCRKAAFGEYQFNAARYGLEISLRFRECDGYYQFFFEGGTINVSQGLFRAVQQIGERAGVPIVLLLPEVEQTDDIVF